MKKQMVGMELPTVLGVGISGPVLAFLTATLFAAFKGSLGWGDGAYATIMLLLSGALAAFPVLKSEYAAWQKFIAWPVASVMIFASAWGSSTGLSAGEDALAEEHAERRAYMAMVGEPGETVYLAESNYTFSVINAGTNMLLAGEYVSLVTNTDATIPYHFVRRVSVADRTNIGVGVVFDVEGIMPGETGRVLVVDEDADTVNPRIPESEMFLSETDSVFSNWETNEIDYCSDEEIPIEYEDASVVHGGFFKRLW